MMEIKDITHQNSEGNMAITRNNKIARADRKAWKRKLKRKQRRHKMI